MTDRVSAERRRYIARFTTVGRDQLVTVKGFLQENHHPRRRYDLADGADIEKLATDTGYSWQVELGASRRSTTVPQEVLAKAFELPMPAEDTSLVDFVVTPTGDAQVISLLRVYPGRLDALEQQALVSLQRQTSGEYANLVNIEFQRGLRERADISVN